MTKYAEIGFQRKVGNMKTLTYEVPLETEVGSLVQIPLRNEKTHGIVLKIQNRKPPYSTREIDEICATSILQDWQIKLILWISDYYFCQIHKVIKLFIPKKIFSNKNIREKEDKSIKAKRETKKTLTKEQKNAIDTIVNSDSRLFLLQGITGSGKTEIYARLAKENAKTDKQTLILIPEISLTPQTVEYFEKTTESKISVIHSKLSEGERIKAWKDIRSKKSKIVIGSRSAIFSPFQNLATIIIDEEHEPSYKQEQAPRYDARKVALKMSELLPELKVVFGSATPSCETFLNKKIIQIFLRERIDNTPLPEVEIADMREEIKKKNFSIFSDTLRTKIEQALERKEQVILFLNRRGSATAVTCRDCGYKVQCKDCNVCMTYHKNKGRLICHHCGLIDSPPVKCPECKSPHIKYIGIGTQKIEDEVKKAFPNARTLRADKDTTSKKHDFEEIYRKFRNHEADILIGTQMIGKGLHLPKISLVGVILADISLGIPDFRSSERTFQLMTQVAGRAGRGKIQGEVVIQTYEPEHEAIKHAQKHDFENFIQTEKTIRQATNYPPFTNLIKLTFTDPSEQICIKETDKLETLLLKHNTDCEITSYPALITKKHGKFHYHVLIKGKNARKLLEKTKMPEGFKIDVDPISIN